MSFKKNLLSVLIWIPFSLVVCGLFGLALYENLPQIPFVNNFYLQIGFTVLAFVLTIGVFIGIRKLSKKEIVKNTLLLEALLFAVLLGAGVLVRCIYFIRFTGYPPTDIDNAYFSIAQVTGEGIPHIAHGAEYFYLILLRGMFLLFGNHLVAGYILQIVLQCLACVSWYIGIRKLSGPGAGLIFMEGVLLLPQSGFDCIAYSPNYLYLFLTGIVFVFITNVLKYEYDSKPFKWFTCILRFLLGASIGILIYLDVTGCILLIPALAIVFVGRNPQMAALSLKQKLFRVALQLFAIVLGAFLSLTVSFYIDAWQSGNSVKQVLDVWFTLFSYKGIGEVPVIFTYWRSTWAIIAILFLLVLGCFAFFTRKKTENQLVWMFMLLAGFGIHFTSLYTPGMNCDPLLLFLVLGLTDAGVLALVKNDNISQVTENALLNTQVKEVNEVTYQEFNSKTEIIPPTVTTEDQNPTEGKVNFIENPLPLPKKHVKRTMDYGIEIPAEQMEFDIQTSDMDDFDIP